jgi:hypothetical protein
VRAAIKLHFCDYIQLSVPGLFVLFSYLKKVDKTSLNMLVLVPVGIVKNTQQINYKKLVWQTKLTKRIFKLTQTRKQRTWPF